MRRKLISFLILLNCAADAFGSERVGVIVPAYFYPGKIWAHLIAEKKSHPAVPLYLIANPNSGPGAQPDVVYKQAIDEARAAGIVVVGYVFTHYGKRPAAAVTDEIHRWETWYKIDGIFLDEMKYDPGAEDYYRAFTRRLHANQRITIGNPGTTIAKTYDDTVDVLMIHESPGVTDGLADGATASVLPARLASISTQMPALNMPQLLGQHVGLIYPTDEKDPPTYERLPVYFDELMKDLDTP